MATSAPPAPPPAIVHAAQRDCTSHLLSLPPDQRADGAWIGYPSGPWDIVVHCRQEAGSSVITQDVESHYIQNRRAETPQERKQHSIGAIILSPIVLLAILAVVAESNPRPTQPKPTLPSAVHLSLFHTSFGR